MLPSIILCLILGASTVYGGGLGSSHYCDPVGTQTTTSYGYMGERPFGQHALMGHPCHCHIGFYGDRCQFLQSCLSGRLRNVSCSTFEKPETVENHFRCIAPGQTEVQICSCFIGYFGPRCEYRTRPVLQLGPQQPSPAGQDGRSGFPTRQGSRSRDFGDEERVWWKDMPVYKMLLFALDIIIFVILISCCRCVFAKFSQRRQMRREMVLRQEENHGREAPRWPLWWMIDEPGPEYSESQSPPPSYEDAMARAKLLAPAPTATAASPPAEATTVPPYGVLATRRDSTTSNEFPGKRPCVHV